MLTKNFFNFAMVQTGGSLTGNVLVDYTGETSKCDFSSSAEALKAINNLVAGSISTSSGGVRIGTGVTPPTANDYTLESMLIEGFRATIQGEATYSLENDHISVSATYGITNTGKIALVISEIGLFGKISANPAKCCLLERTVLENPITINPGQAKYITYTIRFNYPTA